jgi:hypothetical protein
MDPGSRLKVTFAVRCGVGMPYGPLLFMDPGSEARLL